MYPHLRPGSHRHADSYAQASSASARPGLQLRPVDLHLGVPRPDGDAHADAKAHGHLYADAEAHGHLHSDAKAHGHLHPDAEAHRHLHPDAEAHGHSHPDAHAIGPRLADRLCDDDRRGRVDDGEG